MKKLELGDSHAQPVAYRAPEMMPRTAYSGPARTSSVVLCYSLPSTPSIDVACGVGR